MTDVNTNDTQTIPSAQADDVVVHINNHNDDDKNGYDDVDVDDNTAEEHDNDDNHYHNHNISSSSTDGSSNCHSTVDTKSVDVDQQQHYDDTNEDDPSRILAVNDRDETESTSPLVEGHSLVHSSNIIRHENEDDVESPQVTESSLNNNMQQPMDAAVVTSEQSPPAPFNNAIDAYVVQNGTNSNNDDQPVFEAIPYQDPNELNMVS